MAHPVLKTPAPAGAAEATAPKRNQPRGMKAVFTHRLAKPVVFLLCLIPFALLVYWWSTDQLGFNPTETLLRFTGNWTLRFLLITLGGRGFCRAGGRRGFENGVGHAAMYAIRQFTLLERRASRQAGDSRPKC